MFKSRTISYDATFNIYKNMSVKVHIRGGKREPCITFILETASSACIIRVVFVGCPSQTNCVDPRYLARNNTPSIKTDCWSRSRIVFPFL